jgi:hypothetical protein
VGLGDLSSGIDWRSEVGLQARSKNVDQVRKLDSGRAEDLDVFHTVHIEHNVPLAPIVIGGVLVS